MHAVEDDLDHDIRSGEGRARDPGIAVVVWAHRVEEMRDGVDAEVEPGVRLLGRRVGVAEGDRHSSLEQSAHEIVCALKLWRERHKADGAGCEETVQQLRVRVAARVRRMRAEPRGGEERTFEMCTQDTSASGCARQLAKRGDDVLLGRGHEGRKKGRDAGCEERLAGATVPLGVGVEEIDACETVDLEIDESGHSDAAAARRRETDGGHVAVGDLDVALNDPAADQCSLDSKSHEPILAFERL